MKAMHEFNDLKDAALRLLAGMAQMQHTSVRSLYEKYQISFE